MKKLSLYIMLALLITTASCSKFTEVTPKGLVLPQTVSDYEQFLNDVLLADAGYGYADISSDDITFPDVFVTSMVDNRTSKHYLWLNEVFKANEDDQEWNKMYANIYTCNLVLANIGAATGGTAADKDRVTAEAKVHRAYVYFTLASLFGKDYQAATADKDLAVPLLLVPDLEAKPARATVKQVMDQVQQDLKEALATAGLPDLGRNYVHPGKAAAYALQARVCLYTGNYSGALQSATAALAIKNTILDYNSLSFVNPAKPYGGVNGRPAVDAWPENLLARTNSLNGAITRFMISDDFLKVLGEKDLRYVYTFTRITSSGTPSANPLPDYFSNAVNYSIGVPEMLLIQAECLAREGKKEEAITLLNTLRKKRFKPADYTDLTAATADDALVQVMQERRRELFMHGLRWFDLKRLNRDPRFKKDLSRTYNGTAYTLPAGDPRYVQEINPKIIQLNNAIVPNPR